MFLSKILLTSLFVLAVHGKANFTNGNFDEVEVGEPFTVTWIGNKAAVSISLMYGDPTRLSLHGKIVENLSGNSYKWVPAKVVPKYNNSLTIQDLQDNTTDYSHMFTIKGATTPTSTPVPKEPVPTASTTPTPTPTATKLADTKKGGLSSTAKIAISVTVPVVAIILGICFGLWLRNRRNNNRLRQQPIRTMSTDNTPTRNKHDNRYDGPTEPEKAAQGFRSRSHTVGSDSTTSTFRRLFLNEKTKKSSIEQVSTGTSDPERDATPSRHRASSSISYNDKTLMTPPQGDQRTTWDDSPTPPNNRRSANGNIQREASNGRRYSRYSSPANDPESPTPNRRVVSAPILERSFEDARGSPPPNPEDQRWELSGGTPYQSHSKLARSPSELRASSPPIAGSSSSSVMNDARRQDPYAGVSFGDSDDPDVIVHHLAAQREKVRAERERLRKMQELATVEEDLDRQIEAARQNRG